jgi:hypothetical protein
MYRKAYPPVPTIKFFHRLHILLHRRMKSRISKDLQRCNRMLKLPNPLNLKKNSMIKVQMPFLRSGRRLTQMMRALQNVANGDHRNGIGRKVTRVFDDIQCMIDRASLTIKLGAKRHKRRSIQQRSRSREVSSGGHEAMRVQLAPRSLQARLARNCTIDKGSSIMHMRIEVAAATVLEGVADVTKTETEARVEAMHKKMRNTARQVMSEKVRCRAEAGAITTTSKGSSNTSKAMDTGKVDGTTKGVGQSISLPRSRLPRVMLKPRLMIVSSLRKTSLR